MHSFIKENASLIAALALPIIFAAFFFISKQLTINDAPPPMHDFILSQNVEYNNSFDIKVIDNRLSVKFIYPTINNSNNLPHIQAPELYYVRASTMIAEPIGLNIPDDARTAFNNKAGTSITIPITRLEKINLSPIKISPDGYELDNSYYYGSGNLMTEIFDARKRDVYSTSLKNGSTRHEIKGLKQNSSLSIIGWVIP